MLPTGHFWNKASIRPQETKQNNEMRMLGVAAFQGCFLGSLGSHIIASVQHRADAWDLNSPFALGKAGACLQQGKNLAKFLGSSGGTILRCLSPSCSPYAGGRVGSCLLL